MTKTAWLPKFLRWMFAFFSIVMSVFGVAVLAVLVADPGLPSNLHSGSYSIEINGMPGTILFQNSGAVFKLLNGSLVLTLQDASGLFETLKHYGLPVLILECLFYAVLFDLMRRLFRNVGRGESFTRPTVRLVQIIGISLLIFSLVSAIADGWFHTALYTALSQHAAVTVAGTVVHFPRPEGLKISGGGGFPFSSPVFFTGLLVLALSEVFRQGLVLKSEHDLTV